MITIIIPTYNRSRIIKATIDSVLNQSFKFFELIIVDDGSNDNTESTIKNINDDRINYIRYENNRGACYARNLGIKKAKYSIIAFQDSDDLWYENYLEEQYEEFNKVFKIYDAQICRYRRKIDSIVRIFPSDVDVNKGIRLDYLFKKNIVSTQILLVKKEALIKINGFDESLPAFQDWDLAIRLIKNKSKINILDKVLVDVIVSEDSISKNEIKRFEAIELIYKKNLSYFNDNKRSFYNFSYTVFRFYCKNGISDKQKWIYFKNCMKFRPFQYRNLVLFAHYMVMKIKKLLQFHFPLFNKT